MKKISSKSNTINFHAGYNNDLEITSDGIIVSDEIARLVYNRFGEANIIVESIDIDSAINNILGSVDINSDKNI